MKGCEIETLIVGLQMGHQEPTSLVHTRANIRSNVVARQSHPTPKQNRYSEADSIQEVTMLDSRPPVQISSPLAPRCIHVLSRLRVSPETFTTASQGQDVLRENSE